ncbi:MAG: DNA polymerase III subunit beta [bacterium]|nr:DNA polymerase III subunit beta [bacterium]
MHIKCLKSELLQALQVIFPAISTKTSLPVLSNVLLKITENNTLILISTDLEMTIKTYINATVIKKGGITIPAKRLLDITKELGTEEIELKVNEDFKVYLTSGKSKFTIMGLDEEDYPVIPEIMENDVHFVIDKDLLKNMINKTIFSVSYDETRHVLNGIYVKVEDNKIIMVSTDGRRLCYIDNKFDAENSGNFDFILSTKTISELNKLIGMLTIDDVEIGIKDNQVAFKIDKHIMLAKLIQGIFPNYSQIIDQNFSMNIDINKEDLFAITKRVSILNMDKTESIKYSFWNNKLNVSVATQGIGEAEDEIDIVYEGSVFDIAYNPNYIMDVLRNMESDEISLMLSTPINPCAIKEKGTDSSYLCVIMPMRI